MDFWLKYKRILQFFALKPPVLARKGGRVKGTEGLSDNPSVPFTGGMLRSILDHVAGNNDLLDLAGAFVQTE